MADTKITALTALTAADPANDVIPIVDVSDTSMAASGTTKKISVNNILGASGTATLASATITGALTTQGTQVKLSNQAAADCTVLIGPDTASAARSGRIGYVTSSAYKNWFLAASWNTIGGFEFTQSTAVGGTTMATTPSFRINADSTFNFLDGAGGTRMTLNSTSNLVLAGGTAAADGVGVTFPATQVASSDANCLDDYEEGTFTPTVVGTTVAGVGVYSAQVGRYTKVGNLVSVQVYITWSAHTGTGNLSFAGLPFNLSSDLNYYSAATFGLINDLTLTAGNVLTGFATNGGSSISAYQYPTGGGSTSAVAMDAAAGIIYTMTYKV